MIPENLNYLKLYEERLEQTLLKHCTDQGTLDGKLLSTPDIDGCWMALAPEYLADAVPEIADYPLVALGWAMFLGLAMAKLWDTDWATYGKTPAETYRQMRNHRGFDCMDEYILEEVLRLDEENARRLTAHVQRCAQTVETAIRKEEVEPSTPLAFNIFTASINVLYRCGAAIELHALGYRFERIEPKE